MTTKCIYPGPHGKMSPEHYLPAALGKFEGFLPLTGKVYEKCNNRLWNPGTLTGFMTT